MVRVDKNTNTYRVCVLAVSNMLLQLLGFAYRIMLTELVGTEALGLQSLVMQVYSISVSICISGMSVAVTTMAARLAGKGAGGIKKLATSAFCIYLLLFAMMALPIFAFRGVIAKNLIGDEATKNSLILILVCIFLTGIENLLKSIHLGTGRVRTTAASELTEQIARFILVTMLLKNYSNGTNPTAVFLIILGMVMSEFFSVAFLGISYVKNFGRSKKDDICGLTGELVKILVPTTFTGIAGTVFASCAALILPNRLIVAGYTRSTALAAIGMLNSVASPIVMLPMALIGAISAVFLPAVSEAAGANDVAKLKRLVGKSMYAVTVVSFAINLAFLPFAQPLSKLLFNIVPNEAVFIILSAKAVIIYFQVLCASILNGLMKQKTVLLYAVIGEVSQLILIYLLSAMPGLHIFGYLISMAVGEGIRLILSIRAISREIGAIPLTLGDVIPTAIIGVLLYLYSCHAAERIIVRDADIVRTIVTMLAVSLIGIIAAYAMREAKKGLHRI